MSNDGSRHPGVTTDSSVSTKRRELLQTIGTGALSLGCATQSVSASDVLSFQQDDGRIGPKRIAANEDAGFNFPYYLYVPPEVREKPLLVEPVNSGGCDDDFQVDLNRAEQTASGGIPRKISDDLGVPLIVPVFANPCHGDFYQRFVQTLDTETMHIESGRFERIDLQLLRMAEDAQSRLRDRGIDVPSKMMMNGFSASGNFVNNFTMMHPDQIASVTAGAINGMAILPYEEVDGFTANYQIGVADLAEITGESFDREGWQDVPQFCYMGETEAPPQDDTLPYRDVWSEKQATKARAIYGDDMQTERMTYSEMLYHQADASARFDVYDGIGHSYSPEIIEDVKTFHARHNDIPFETDESEESEDQTDQLEASSCETVEELTHDAVDIGFASRPTIGDEEVEVTYSVGDSFGQKARIRLFPESGGGHWGIGLDFIDPGQSGTRSYDINPNALALGERVEVRAFPRDWSYLEDVIASECAVVTGIRYAKTPQPGDSEISVEYMYPEDVDGTGEIRLTVDGDRVATVDGITPGTVDRQSLTLSDRSGLSGEVSVGLSLVSSDTDTVIDTTTVTTRPEGIASVSFAGSPVAEQKMLTLDYGLDSEYDVDRFAALRLYTEASSSWGIYVGQVEPGESGREDFTVSSDEPGVPLELDEGIEVALVDGDDPYATSPLATASSTVVSEDDAQEASESPDTGPSVTFEDQPYTGDPLVVSKVVASEDTLLRLSDGERVISEEVELAGGNVHEDIEVQLTDPPTEDTQIVAIIASVEGNEQLATDTATVRVNESDQTNEEESNNSGQNHEDEPNDSDQNDEDESGNDPESSGPTAVFTYRPEEPVAGEQVAFNATDSMAPSGKIVKYEWEFGDVSATGVTATHTFENNGGYNVSLTVTTDQGYKDETIETLTIDSATQASSERTRGESGPGFGVGSVLTGLGGVGYLLKRRLTEDNEG
jgi:hypothetical protein